MSVDGIDGCWIGPGDLSLSMGVDLSTTEGKEAHESLILKVFEACKKVNKIPGIYAPNASEALRRAEQGGLFMTSGGDGPWAVEGANETLRQLGR